jgi:hypothetical protein
MLRQPWRAVAGVSGGDAGIDEHGGDMEGRGATIRERA